MKKVISFFLFLTLLFNTVALTGCSLFVPEDQTPDTNEEEGEDTPGTESPEGDEGEKPDEEPSAPPLTSELISEEDLKRALADALIKIDYMMETIETTKFPAHNSTGNVYPTVSNTKGWNEGFYTGMLWHAYQMSGQGKYKTMAVFQIPTYTKRIEEKLGVDTHDMGFVYTPSCVAAYKIAKNEAAKAAALKAADQLLSRYHEKGEFIQAWGKMGATNNYRLIVDCLMNIPLLFWASEVTGDAKYYIAALNHFNTTLSVCYREDGSTYHTYFFDPETGEPTRGATHQGVNDESTWARGQAWAMYGPLLTYSYTKHPAALGAFKSAANYFIDHLPSDYIPYWDFTYTDGSFEEKDSSAAAIAICALLEGIKYMDETDPMREKFYTAACNMMNSLMQNYTTRDNAKANGLLLHGTYNHNSNTGVDEMVIWGDYFYMEALNRFLHPDWEMYW